MLVLFAGGAGAGVVHSSSSLYLLFHDSEPSIVDPTALLLLLQNFYASWDFSFLYIFQKVVLITS